MQQGVFPDILKIGNITPVYKNKGSNKALIVIVQYRLSRYNLEKYLKRLSTIAYYCILLLLMYYYCITINATSHIGVSMQCVSNCVGDLDTLLATKIGNGRR